MRVPSEWLIPYAISNAAAVGLMVLAIFKPTSARVLFAILFGAAAVANTRMAILNPNDYLAYADYALLGIYRDFILGVFSDYIRPFVLSIALGQALVSILLCFRSTAYWGLLGAAVFLAAIAPLGVGSAFPFSLICLVGLACIAKDIKSRKRKVRTVKAVWPELRRY